MAKDDEAERGLLSLRCAEPGRWHHKLEGRLCLGYYLIPQSKGIVLFLTLQTS
jgi:hypothetical protein